MAAEQMVAGRFEISELIGRGGFGQVYLAQDTVRGDQAAVKKMRGKRFGALWRESRFYRKLAGERACVPNFRYFGTEENGNVLVTDLMGQSLWNLFERCGFRFSLKTVLMIGSQTVQGLEHLHKLGIIHRDVKPDNFVMGLGANAHKVYLIDFGEAGNYLTPSGTHIPFREGIEFRGTVRYMSVNVHQKKRASRRDDLESLGYMLIEFLKAGKGLPWSGLQERPFIPKIALVHKKKMDISVEQLCQGIPGEFRQFLEHCRGLEYEQTPDYQFLNELFVNLFREMGYQNDKVFDWTHKLTGNVSFAGGPQQRNSEEGTGSGNALLEVEHQPQYYVTRYGRQSKPPGRLVQEN